MEKEFWIKLAEDNPNGVSFLPNSVRLWAKRAGIEPENAEKFLKPYMVQLGNLWYCEQMLADEEQWTQVLAIADNMITDFGFFSAGAFLGAVQDLLPKVRDASQAAAVLSFIGYDIVEYEGRNFCLSDVVEPLVRYITEEIFYNTQPDEMLDMILQKTGDRLYRLLQESGELCLENLIADDFANLQLVDLELIRDKFLPVVYSQRKGYFTFWSLAEDFNLPEDFSKRITGIIDLLIRLRRSLGISNLSYALDILYNTDFRKEYGLDDDKIFLDQCLRAYKEQEKLRPDFAKKVLKYSQASRENNFTRTRSQETTFADLDIPIGATLFFLKDPSITCTVCDGGSKVFYGHEELYISTLANKLLNQKNNNGFKQFLFEGETLWQRRLRLEKNNYIDKIPNKQICDNKLNIIIRRNNIK